MPWSLERFSQGRLPRVIPEEVLPVYPKVTCVSLVYKDPFRVIPWTENLDSYLMFLDQTSTHLKHLSVEIRIKLPILLSPNEKMITALTNLWPRLEFLQVCLFSWRPLGSFPYADRIAPGMQWIHGEADLGQHAGEADLKSHAGEDALGPYAALLVAGARRKKICKTVFWVDRHHKEKPQR